MTKTLDIIHLSDVHLRSPASHGQGIILEALKEDLSASKSGARRPDLLVFSGDIVDKADNEDAFIEALSLIVEIQQIVGVDEEHTILCAGNHDLKRSFAENNIDTLRSLRQASKSSREMNELVVSKSFMDYATSTFGSFYSLEQSFGAAYRVKSNVLSSTYRFPNLEIAVISLNSAVLCAGGLKSIEGDERALSIAERTITEALTPIPKGEKVLFIVHHPSNWLNQESEIVFERLISKFGCAVLFGHMHYAKPLDVTSAGGRALMAQSGALYDDRDPIKDYWNGYSNISICLETGFSRISFRRWQEKRREFAKAEDLGSKGEFFSSDEARVFWQAESPNFDLEALQRWRYKQVRICLE